MADRVADPNLNREHAIRGAQRAIANLDEKISKLKNKVEMFRTIRYLDPNQAKVAKMEGEIEELERQRQVRQNELEQLIVLQVEESKKTKSG